MKIYSNGLIRLDVVDIICLGLIMGYSTGTIIKMLKKYYLNKHEDPLVSELKRIVPVKKIIKDRPLNLFIRHFPRGGQLPPRLEGFSLLIKNKKLGKLVIYLLKITKRIRQLKRVNNYLSFLNLLLFQRLGFAFASGRSLNYIEIILVVSTSSVAGLLLSVLAVPGGFMFVLGPILTLLSRYEYIAFESINICKLLCEVGKDYHNEKLVMEMKSLETEIPFIFNLEEGPLQRRGESELYRRYLENQEKIRKRVQNFNEFKEKFPECNDSSIEDLKEKIGKIQEKIRTEL